MMVRSAVRRIATAGVRSDTVSKGQEVPGLTSDRRIRRIIIMKL